MGGALSMATPHSTVCPAPQAVHEVVRSDRLRDAVADRRAPRLRDGYAGIGAMADLQVVGRSSPGQAPPGQHAASAATLYACGMVAVILTECSSWFE
jgi:hypothetical protein